MANFRSTLLVAVLLLLFGQFAYCNSLEGKVVGVIDGDTIILLEERRVRKLGF